MEDFLQPQPSMPKDRRPDALGDLQVLPDEIICAVLDYLSPADVARLSCVSSVMYIFCNEEPLWMSLCLSKANGPLQFRGSWKKTTLALENVPNEYIDYCRKPLHFDGFGSLFLYRRLYRCHTSLNEFSVDNGTVERKKDLSAEEFNREYGGKKPVLFTSLADTWPARSAWTVEKLSMKCGDIPLKISQRSPGKISMKFKDYVSYMNLQRDEDPLYIFDEKFGEAVPDLLKDYSVPHLFQEDFFEVLDEDSRPPFRWLIIGPERSGASWHVDPALTSAWNTLLCGRKRWALYPPGRVPMGVTVHVNDEDGDVNVETPSSLQWWLDFYPLLADEEKPIECIQLPGETIFVPSGWWHCVLNLETTIAVTQNFVNSENFEFACLDMAPGYRHKGVCRAGLLALDESCIENIDKGTSYAKNSANLTHQAKRARVSKPQENRNHEGITKGASQSYDLWKDFSYDIDFLSKFLDKERDHYTSPWSPGNCIGPREMREWLFRLWVGKPGMRDLIWKGACLALNANRWLECLQSICNFHNLASPTEEEKLPVGTGSNPVYVMADYVVKFFVEGGLESSIHGLCSELEFYRELHKVDSSLKSRIPGVFASGIIYLENGSYKTVPWDGKGVPDVINKCNLIPERSMNDGFSFGVWSKIQFECKRAGLSDSTAGPTKIWPYLITECCKGKIFAQLRDTLSWEDVLSLASFLGKQLRNLHLLPYPPCNISIFSDVECSMEDQSEIPAEWEFFIRTLSQKKKDVVTRLTTWGDPIPKTLIEKVHEYVPDDLVKLLCIYEDENGKKQVSKPCSWIHSDIMDDNIFMEPRPVSRLSGNFVDATVMDNGLMNEHDDGKEGNSWCPSYILDFSDLSIGDPIYDLIPVHLDVFRGDSCLLKKFFESYRLPMVRRMPKHEPMSGDDKFGRLSYHAMCYCILHDENTLAAIFSLWKELRTAKSWEEVELTVWGELNNYKGFE